MPFWVWTALPRVMAVHTPGFHQRAALSGETHSIHELTAPTDWLSPGISLANVSVPSCSYWNMLPSWVGRCCPFALSCSLGDKKTAQEGL